MMMMMMRSPCIRVEAGTACFIAAVGVSVERSIREYSAVLFFFFFFVGVTLLILTEPIRFFFCLFFFFLLCSAIRLTSFQDVVRMLKEPFRL